MTASEDIAALVERFARNIDHYHRPEYNETQVRREFIDPLFVALGWDVENRRGVAPRYQEVIHEATVRERAGIRSPDYCFRVGAERKFFVEAKKPAVDIRGDIHPAYQLRRYAWTAKLPLSVLTDFEEFSVYDCRFKPAPREDAAKARIMYVTYDQYAERWDEIAAVFSREAVWGGDFDRYAETTRSKRGTQEVDAAFLQSIEEWRLLLARNIALRNAGLGVRELNYAVQQIIDRVIFLRICEDRDIEPYEQLKDTLRSRPAYPQLVELFRRADDRYNSGLFHFRAEAGRAEGPDTLTPALHVDDKVLAGIIGSLYYPDSPYEFSVLGADILGDVYEQFLGSVIRLTPAHRAVVEQKPDVRKAGGVYYTPRYIVDYIVEQTVGKLIDGKTPGQIAGLRVLDPACGSGSFLLGAYGRLLDHHRDWYVEHPTAAGRREIYQGVGGDWFLTTGEKKRILLNNIYGVDLDAQAVEVTKLSLLLKVLEEESGETLGTQAALWQERALPDLGSNVKCGNSLIGPDFYEGRQMGLGLLDDEEAYRINAFDWVAEFPAIMRAGGFDAVIGNPPYVSFGLRNVGKLTQEESAYYRTRFAHSAEYKLSLYAIFTEIGLRLLRPGGIVSFIVPDSFLLGRYFSKIRRHILNTSAINELLMTKCRVFRTGTVGISVIFNLTRKLPESRVQESLMQASLATSESQFADSSFRVYRYPQGYFERVPLNRFRLFFSQEDRRLVDQIEGARVVPLREIVRFSSGLIGKAGKTSIIATEPRSTKWKPGLLSGEEMGRYATSWAGGYICFDVSILKSGFKDARYDEPKLLFRQTGDSLIGTYDDTGLLCLNNLHVGNLVQENYALTYVLAILNSGLIDCYYGLISLEKGRTLAQIDIETLDLVPIRTIDFDDPADVARHDRLVALVERMLDLQRQLADARTPAAQTQLQRQIAATDRQIDRLVYELYDLTEEEIAIVEGA